MQNDLNTASSPDSMLSVAEVEALILAVCDTFRSYCLASPNDRDQLVTQLDDAIFELMEFVALLFWQTPVERERALARENSLPVRVRSALTRSSASRHTD